MKKSKFLIRSLQIVLLIITFILVERFCHQKTGGFHLSKIESDHPFNAAWATPLPTELEMEEIDRITNQRFTFFGYGGQAYVFLGDDGKTVLKLFKQHHMSVPTWFKKIPLPKTLNRVRNKFIFRKEGLFTLFYNSCKIAYDDFKERTGMIYLHLNSTDYLQKKITLIDKLGIAHQIDLDQTDFALQHKAKLPKRHFRSLKKRNDVESAKKSIDSMLGMIVERSTKGIADRDPNIRRNCGFLGNNAIEIDLGSYTRNEALKIPFVCKTDIYQKTLQLKRMVSKSFPEVYPYLEEQLDEVLYGTNTNN